MINRVLVKTLLAAAATLAFLACSTGVPAGVKQNPTTGLHPDNWSTVHWSEYLANPASCNPCHGSVTDTTKAGGTSSVSCFGCHHPEGPAHPAGFGDPAVHGTAHAALAADNSSRFTFAGIQSCQICHGADYNTPVGFTKACFSCHTNNAPHPDPAHWVNTAPGQPNHDHMDQSNAAACFVCHVRGLNSTLKPTHPATGTVPGCFNNTMCHGGTDF